MIMIDMERMIIKKVYNFLKLWCYLKNYQIKDLFQEFTINLIL